MAPPRPHRPRPRAHAPAPPAERIIVPAPLATVRRRVSGLARTVASRVSARLPATGYATGARGVSVASIAAGALLFAVAGVATPVVTGSVEAGRPTSPGRATSGVTPPVVPSMSAAASSAPVGQRDRSSAKAPADPVTVSALAGNGIPKVALNAYRVAAARVDHTDPSCRIDWSLIAGIGRAESDHGRFAGSTLRSDGTSTPPIVGPALTGSRWEYFPADPRYVAVTGDSKYAHALGPMQFIPSTWAGYGVDGNRDGRADIFNINDAALAAARYLCTAGGDLGTRAGRVRAVLAYNHNDQYLAQVLALADAYKRGVPVTGIPVGDTTGGLPAVARTGTPPPANPGAPTAADAATRQRDAKPRRSSATPSSRAAPSTSPTSTSTRSEQQPAPGAGSSRSATRGPTATTSPTSATPEPSGSSQPATSPTCTFLGLPAPCPSR